MFDLDFSKWKGYEIGDLFDVSKGKRIVKGIDYINRRTETHIYPTITATMQNNGIDSYYKTFNCSGSVIISCGEVSGMYSTYHNEKCWVLDTMRILKPKFNLTENIALFLIPLLNANMIKFSYGLPTNPNDIKKIRIKLPIDSQGNTDWQFMEEYIKSLPYSKYL